MGDYLTKKGFFFDLDGTLLDGNSTDLMVKFFIKKKLIQKREIISYLKYLLQLKLNTLSYSEFARIVAKRWKNHRLEKLTESDEEFYETWLKPRLFPYFINLLLELKQAGKFLFIISSANYLAARPLLKPLGLTDICATKFETDNNGIISGNLIKPLCYKSGKVYYFKKICQEYGIKIEDTLFFSNSINDISLLRIAGKAVTVNPDHVLKKIALRKNWEILSLKI